MSEIERPEPIGLIPPPQPILECLARILREADLLRAQLRLSRRAAQEAERQERQAVGA